jgi:hypothetical protein
MREDIIIPIAGMLMIVVLSIGVPLVIGFVRRWEKQPARPALPPEASARLERIEQAIDAMAIEVERISESQRFVARLMAERAPDRVAIPGAGEQVPNERR